MTARAPMLPHEETVEIAPGVALVVRVTDEPAAHLDQIMRRGPGEEPELVSRLPIPCDRLHQLGDALRRAGEVVR